MFKKLEKMTFGKINPEYHDLIERWFMVVIFAILYFIL